MLDSLSLQRRLMKNPQRTYVQNFHVTSSCCWRNTNLSSNILVTSVQDQRVAMLLATNQKAGRLPSFSLCSSTKAAGRQHRSFDWTGAAAGDKEQWARSEILAAVLFMDGF